MYQIIKSLFTTHWSNSIAFKGGTLAYFIHDLDRFSTDIDIDCLHGLPNDQQTQDIHHILTTYGHIKDIQKFQHMHRYIFSYGEADHNIKVELNARIWKANKYETISFFGTPIQVMDKSSMFANKLVAVINRSHPTSRDLRDVHFFFSHHFPINEKVIQERTEMESKEFFLYLKSYIQENFVSMHVVDANLGLVLTEEQKKRAKKNLINNITNYIELLLFDIRK